MCVATKIIGELEDLILKVDKEHSKFINLLSEADCSLNDFYKKVLDTNFNAVEGYFLTKELQLLLQQRRLIKEELGALRIIHRRLNKTNIQESIPLAQTSLNSYHTRYGDDGWYENFRFDELPKY